MYRPQKQKKLGLTGENTGIDNQEDGAGDGETVGESIRNHV